MLRCCTDVILKRGKLFVRDPAWPVLRLNLNLYKYEMLITERELCLYFTAFLNNRQHQLRISLINQLFTPKELKNREIIDGMHSTRSYFLNEKLDLPLTVWKQKPLDFAKVLYKIFTERESNDRQTLDWMNSVKLNYIQSQSLCQTLNVSNSKRMPQCLVVILPIEKYKLLKFGAHKLLMLSSSWMFLAAREGNEWQSNCGWK